MADKDKVDAASQKKAALAPVASANPTTSENATETAQQYRDRAAERRQILGQPDHPMPEGDGRHQKKARYEAGPAPPAPIIQPNNAGITEDNVGHKLLQAAGWKKGEVLGTSGAGTVDPISVKMFASGAGIGADKGVEVGKGNPSDWRSNEFGRTFMWH